MKLSSDMATLTRTEIRKKNDTFILRELMWLNEMITKRLRPGSKKETSNNGELKEEKIALPNLGELVYNRFLNEAERCIHALALAPHILPNFLDDVFNNNLQKPGDFPQLGGVRGKHFRGILPTGETAIFLLSKDKMNLRIDIMELFNEDHFFAEKKILWLEELPQGEPKMSGKIIMSSEYLDLLIFGKSSRPKFGMNFPAQRINTELNWSDLVLHPGTKKQIKDLENWIHYGSTLLSDWGLAGRVKPGYRVLFYGPPGTGKTMAATLLGKYTGKDVYKVDLSMVVSKFIGETEKNLANLFAIAENRDWILFFDEADALFGKRTDVRDAHDKYANQEVSYLLQRIECYNGLVILSSNFKNNIDDSFLRRFQSIIFFPLPNKEERLQLWEKSLPARVQISEEVNLSLIAEKYEVTGANIINIVQQICLKKMAQNNLKIEEEDFEKAILKERGKENKMF